MRIAGICVSLPRLNHVSRPPARAFLPAPLSSRSRARASQRNAARAARAFRALGEQRMRFRVGSMRIAVCCCTSSLRASPPTTLAMASRASASTASTSPSTTPATSGSTRRAAGRLQHGRSGAVPLPSHVAARPWGAVSVQPHRGRLRAWRRTPCRRYGRRRHGRRRWRTAGVRAARGRVRLHAAGQHADRRRPPPPASDDDPSSHACEASAAAATQRLWVWVWLQDVQRWTYI